MSDESIRRYIPRSLVAFYRKIYNWIAPFALYIFRKSKPHNYAGFEIKSYIYDQVSKSWYDHDFTRYEINFLRHGKLKAGATVFNIGAHHGIVALIFSKIVKNQGKVIAVEMDKNHTKIAEINKLCNGANNLQIINAAISDKSQLIHFGNDQVSNSRTTLNQQSVMSVTIDDLTAEYGAPSLIYMDIEGYEYHALRGAMKTIKLKPDFCIEVHSNNGLEKYDSSVEEIISYFKLNKYKLYIAPATNDCSFVKYMPKSTILNDRFYLVAKSS